MRNGMRGLVHSPYWRILGIVSILPIIYMIAVTGNRDFVLDYYVLFQVVGVVSIATSLLFAYLAIRNKLRFWPLWVAGLVFMGPFVCPVAWVMLNRRAINEH